MNNKEMSPSASGEVNNQTPRETYEERGEKAIDANEIEYVTTPYGGVVPRLKKHDTAPEQTPDDSAQGVEIEYVTTPYGGVVPRIKRPNAPAPEPKPEAKPASTNQEAQPEQPTPVSQETGQEVQEGKEVEDFTARLRRQREEMNTSKTEETVEATEEPERPAEDQEVDQIVAEAKNIRDHIKQELDRLEKQIRELEQAHARFGAEAEERERIEAEEKELEEGLEREINEAETRERNLAKGEGIADHEIAHQRKAEAAYEKSKKNPGWQKFKSKLKKIVAGVLISAVMIGSLVGGNMLYNKDKDNQAPQEEQVKIEQSIDDVENQEAEHGIKDGYNEKGMWESSEKPSSYAFASAKEVAEVCNDDECEMMKYTAENQVESFADYLANMPEELQPEGFKGLSILETEAKLESLSDEEYNAIKNQFDQQIDQAFTRRTTLDGSYQNSYMKLKDPSGPVTHDNMELVECTTDENGLKVVEFYWLDQDGNEIGSMTVKIIYDENGNITGGCMQAVNREGSTPVYTGMPSIPEQVIPPMPSTPDNPTPDNPEPDNPKPDNPTPDNPEPDNPEPDNPTPDNPEPDNPTPDNPTPDNPEPETPAPKDRANMTRIDNQILEDIADDIGTGQVTVTPTESVSQSDLTEQPAAEAYEGTAPTIVQNEASVDAEPIQEQISPENDYSQNLGRANAGEYAPVQADETAQAQADAAEIPIEQAPGVQDVGNQDLNDILSDLGIN